MKAFFVTGTDTGIGKTTVASSICAYLSLRKGLDVGVMKPFETGIEDEPSDSLILKETSRCKDDLSLISPYRFRPPLSPYAASLIEKKEIDIEFLDRLFESLVLSHDITVVEGAGGVLVPIKKDFFFADLIKRWNLPTLLVASLGLGTINHTLLTIRYLFLLNVEVLGVVLNEKDRKEDPSKRSNPSILKELLPVPILGVFPFFEGERKINVLSEMAEKYLDLSPILSRIP